MQHKGIGQGPALLGLIDNRLERAFGHAGVMFDLHHIEALGDIAHDAGKGNNCPRLCALLACHKGIGLGPQIEWGVLHAHPHLSPLSWAEKTPLRGRRPGAL